MIKISKKENCCGCWACRNVCPTGAIEMQSDSEGFLYPLVDNSKCIHCNLCNNVCPFGDNISLNTIKEVYAIKNKDENIREQSSSGGFFSVLSDYIIKKEGVVYGAIFDKDFNVIHSKAENLEECSLFRGSKYVQSQLRDIHQDVRNILKEGKFVLFSGTPCQVNSLLRYLGKEANSEHLITCDILCHGVPSPLIWHDYLNSVGRNISSVNFRNKRNGWHSSELSIYNEQSLLLSEDQATNVYYQLFLCHYSIRPSCAVCPYASTNRCGDFSIGDFWGIEKSEPEFDDDKGVSLVLVNTDKAKLLYEKLKGNIIFKESNINNCMQPILQHPFQLASKRDEFWKDYKKRGLNHAILFFTYKGNKMWHIRMVKKLKNLKKKIVTKFKLIF